MLKEYPDIIGRSCFVDPVTFCSWEGGMLIQRLPRFLLRLVNGLDICYNFFYRPCMTVRL